MEKAFRVAAMLALCMALLTAAAMASGSHDCVDADGDHFCDECWESVSANCADTDGDHFCDVCWRPVRTACADADGDTWCDVCGGHMSDYCTDADKNHACDVCWAVLGPCLDENKDHLCDLCGGVFWVDENADGICDGCEAVLTHVTAEHVAVYYHQSKGATLADVVLQITVEPYIEVGGAPAGTVAVRWSDDYGNSYSTAEKALTFGVTTVTVEYPSLPMEALEKGGRVTFSPYDAGFTPAENGCVAEYDLPTLWVDSDAEFTVNGVKENKLYLHPGAGVTVVQQPGLTEGWEWVFEEGYAVPRMTVDGLTTTFTMPEESVNMHAAWRCEVCTDADGDGWCDLCEYYIETCPAAAYTDVSADAWYHEAVDHVIENGLMNGVDETTFAPHGGATRADFVYALWSMEERPVVNYLMLYEDVDQEEPYAEAVRWASAMGIAKGYPDGTFRPGETVTREQMAAFLYRYVQHKGGGFTGMWMFLLDYTDRADVGEWAYEPLCWLTMKGVMQGDGTGALNPKKTATRAETAQVLMNYMEVER